MTTADDAVRERDRLAAAISQHIFDEFVGAWSFFFGGEDYELICDEDYTALGYDENDDSLLIIKRRSDGKCFEVELEAWVRPVPTEAERQERAGQLTISEATS
jgi:hypothetical protein